MPPWASQMMTQFKKSISKITKPSETTANRAPLSSVTNTLSREEKADIIHQVSSALGCSKSKASKKPRVSESANPEAPVAPTTKSKRGRKRYPRDENNNIIRPVLLC